MNTDLSSAKSEQFHLFLEISKNAHENNHSVKHFVFLEISKYQLAFTYLGTILPNFRYRISVPAQLDSLARQPNWAWPDLGGSKTGPKESQYRLDHKTIEENEFYDWMSLSYILLCNSLGLSGIQSIFGMEGPWHDKHQPTTSLLW